ncbi:MAG: BofC C-terminal domain-containing protein [Clostridia bacterium]|nr:BofC C-terminal domain-containing protein [Clostridia bacterium]MDR3644011.1 BofC C-terminal domain-containing protein [Clostridia bacterium]
MKAKLIVSIASLLTVATIVPAAVLLPRRAAAAHVTSPASSSATQSGYIVRDYNGKVAVFSAQGGEPQQVLDVYTSTLPQEARLQLQAGIHVGTRDELLALLENYSS